MEVGYNANLDEHIFATIYLQAFDGWKVKANKLKPGYKVFITAMNKLLSAAKWA